MANYQEASSAAERPAIAGRKEVGSNQPGLLRLIPAQLRGHPLSEKVTFVKFSSNWHSFIHSVKISLSFIVHSYSSGKFEKAELQQWWVHAKAAARTGFTSFTPRLQHFRELNYQRHHDQQALFQKTTIVSIIYHLPGGPGVQANPFVARPRSTQARPFIGPDRFNPEARSAARGCECTSCTSHSSNRQ